MFLPFLGCLPAAYRSNIFPLIPLTYEKYCPISHVIAMKLSLPDVDEEDVSVEIIRVKVWSYEAHTWLEPPILVPKHNLTRWDAKFRFEDGELLLQDGYGDNWNEVNDCISLLKGLEVNVTFDNIKVRINCHNFTWLFFLKYFSFKYFCSVFAKSLVGLI